MGKGGTDIYSINSKAWDGEVKRHNFWTLVASQDQIDAAAAGNPNLRVTPFKSVPLNWIKDLKGKDVLIACGGGGQQTPIMAAFGCKVTSLDISMAQIEQDNESLRKYNLNANTVCANILDMTFEDSSFDSVIMPQAMNFIDDLDALYSQVLRVLRDKGSFIFGVANPILYMFDDRVQTRKLKVKYTLPFSDTTSLSVHELQRRIAKGDTVEFSHSLQSIIGDLLDHGFSMHGFFSDDSGSEPTDSFVHDSHLAVLAIKD